MYIYLGMDSQLRNLCLNGDQNLNHVARKEAKLMLCIGKYSIRCHVPMGGKPLAARLSTAPPHFV